MAGASRMAPRQASAVVVSMLSEIPCASLARVLAVAGAMIISSARLPRLTWPISVSCRSENMSIATGRWVSAWKVMGLTNSAAAGVMTTSTFAPALTSRLVRSAAL